MTDEAIIRCSLSRWGGADKRCRWCDAELPPKHRRWCSKSCRRRFTENHVWSVARAVALERDQGRCVRCGGQAADWPLKVVLQVHHKTPVFGVRHISCRHHLDGLETLCAEWWDARQSCHSLVHFGEIVPEGKQLKLDLVA
jgi:hypothetical protein